MYREGAESDRLFFILKGSFKLIKRQPIEQKNQFSQKSVEKGMLGSRVLTKDSELSILSEKESFGEEVLIDKPRRYSVKCN